MTLSTLSAKLTFGKAKALSMVGGLVVAGAALTLAAPSASAQHIGFGIQVGVPQYVAPEPVYVAPPTEYMGPQTAYVAPGYGYGYGYGYAAPRYWDHRGEEWREHHDDDFDHHFEHHWDHDGDRGFYR